MGIIDVQISQGQYSKINYNPKIQFLSTVQYVDTNKYLFLN